MMHPTDEQLIRQIKQAILAGRLVCVGDVTIRYLKRGEQYCQDGQHYQALCSGVFLRMTVLEMSVGASGVVPRTRWGYYVGLDDLEEIMHRHLVGMGHAERAALAVDLAGSAGLASVHGQSARTSTCPPLAAEWAIDPEPAAL